MSHCPDCGVCLTVLADAEPNSQATRQTQSDTQQSESDSDGISRRKVLVGGVILGGAVAGILGLGLSQNKKPLELPTRKRVGFSVDSRSGRNLGG